MKKYLSIIALVFVSSVTMAQSNEKSTEASKTKPAGIIGQGASLLGGALPGGAVISNRISMNVTVGKQTQGATFGEKVNAGLHAAESAVAQGSSVKQDSTSLQTSTKQASGNTSPLYDAQGLEVQNPLYKSETKTTRPIGPIKGVIVKGGKN
ncbi:hypothetical protein [Pedobacter psychroterrae]|uniref:Uncharacterized protein n=1 Tax=Pedobacter psychroterrae TaxID=2530453 RepID=A0A4R0NMQ4_9SPHI|nr:hypothetical protein [Pedobacter psychroterrae]TCD00893.1 hypothetical protein EZ437_08945 [Pedobacter psychroterrae]